MSGTVKGGKRAAATNKAKHGADFYKRLGHLGGTAKRVAPGGFGSSVVGKDGLTGLERARIYGAKGGRVSKRRPRKEAA